jgi:hypothetical protein
MKEKKININRAKITSAEIEERRSFDQLMLQLKTPPNPFYTSIGFWGKTGMAGLVILFVVKSITSLFNNNIIENAYDTNLTLTETTTDLPQDTRCLKPISTENDIPFEYHTIIGGHETEILLREGTRIVIPEAAFSAYEGNEILISTRLFMDKTSAFLAGVPMDYLEDAFESAGMIEIRGEINGKVATINPEAPILVELNMYKHPDGFDFFALDDHSGEWSLYPAEFSTRVNLQSGDSHEEIVQLEKELSEIKASLKSANRNLAQLKMPKESDHFIPKNEQLQFKLDFDNKLFPELASFKTLVFEALPNQYNYSKVVRTTWNDFEVRRNGEQFLATFKRDNEKETLKVRPVVSGKELEIALREYEAAKKSYLTTHTSITKDMEQLQKAEKEKTDRIKLMHVNKKQAELLHTDASTDERALRLQKNAVSAKLMNATASFKMNKWGVFNADKPLAYPMRLNIPVNLVAENHLEEDIDMAFVFDMKKDVRYTYGSVSHSMKNFGINDNTTVIMVLYKNGDIGYAETTRSELEYNHGRLELTPILAKDLNEDKIKKILHEGRFSA